MKKVKIIGLSLLICLIASLMATFMGITSFAYAAEDKKINISSVEEVTRQIFGDVKIKSSEYLYGFNDSPDYIYVDFEGYGYAVYFGNTMELMEYAPTGSLPYSDNITQKYYAGPSNYFSRKGEQFINTLTGENLHLSRADAASYSRQISEVFLQNSVSRQDYLLEVESPMNADGEIERRFPSNTNPDIDTGALITADPPGTAGTTYIPNAQYFTPTNPTHGFNEHGTCGSVAAQLLLSYNNFYNDRRIIAPEHLNGGWNNSTGNGNMHDPANYATHANNPNVCIDPMSVTRQTTGTNDDFYNHVITAIEPGAFNCVCTNTTVTITSGTATVTVTVTRPDGTTTLTTTTRPANPGETNSSNTTHTHNGSSTTAVRNGLRNILGQRLATNQFTVNSDEKGWFFGWSPISSTPIKNEINAGRPVIIGMSSNLGGSDHWVVGYGYQNYTYPTGHANEGQTYSGYVVHFGWTGRIRTWINESWCNAYITMQINHTHNHNIDTGNNIGNDKREVRCACGHRTTVDLYNVSGNTITSPRYPLTGSIIIPSVINGTTITAIGASAFANQTQLSQITIPASVTSIGNSAFSGCTSLSQISIPSSVTKIGYEAFSPSTVLTSYGGNRANIDLVVADGTKDTYIANGWTGFNIVELSASGPLTVTSGQLRGIIEIPSTFNNRIITSIGASGFANQSEITGITLPMSVTSISSSAFANCSNLEYVFYYSITGLASTPDHATSYSNYYYTERSLDVNLSAGCSYTLSFDYSNLTASTDISNVFTSLGVGDNTFAVDLPVQKTFSSSSGTQVIVFTPTEAQLASSNKLWCRFIRTGTPQTVSINISNVEIDLGVTNINIDAFTGCEKLVTPGLSFSLLSDNTYSVTGIANEIGAVFLSLTRTILIPSVYGGIEVSRIAPSAFKDYDMIKWAFI